MAGILRRKDPAELNHGLLGVEAALRSESNPTVHAYYDAAVGAVREFMTDGGNDGGPPSILHVCTFAARKLLSTESSAADFELRRDILKMFNDRSLAAPPRAAREPSVSRSRGGAPSAGDRRRPGVVSDVAFFEGFCDGCGRYGHRMRDCQQPQSRSSGGPRGGKRNAARAFGGPAAMQPHSFNGNYSYPMQPLYFPPPGQLPQ